MASRGDRCHRDSSRRPLFLMVEETIRGDLVLGSQPAGHLEPNESLIARLLAGKHREETGWEVELTDLIGVYQWQKRP